jgi:TELO2-interacting protein 1
VKSVSQAIDKFHVVLKDQVVAENLNEKLAEYAFFPLTHIFNESQRLPSRCLELAVLSLQILIAQGWRGKLAPEMGKQLLILLTLMAGTTPGQTRLHSNCRDLAGRISEIKVDLR